MLEAETALSDAGRVSDLRDQCIPVLGHDHRSRFQAISVAADSLEMEGKSECQQISGARPDSSSPALAGRAGLIPGSHVDLRPRRNLGAFLLQRGNGLLVGADGLSNAKNVSVCGL